jgi:hypothetical protein
MGIYKIVTQLHYNKSNRMKIMVRAAWSLKVKALNKAISTWSIALLLFRNHYLLVIFVADTKCPAFLLIVLAQ